MNTQRAVSVALALAAAALLATGSLGFSSVSAERGVQVNVVDAEDAYVNATACSTNRGNGTSVKVRVTNQYSEPFSIDQITDEDGDEIARGHVPESLDPGDYHEFPSLQANDEVTITVTGGLTATVTVDVEENGDCPGTESSNGSQNASRRGSPPGATNDETTTVGNASTTTVQNETTGSA